MRRLLRQLRGAWFHLRRDTVDRLLVAHAELREELEALAGQDVPGPILDRLANLERRAVTVRSSEGAEIVLRVTTPAAPAALGLTSEIEGLRQRVEVLEEACRLAGMVVEGPPPRDGGGS